MVAQRLVVDARLSVEAFGEALADDLAEVAVADFVLGQKHEVGVFLDSDVAAGCAGQIRGLFFVHVVRDDIDLAANDRLDALFAALAHEVNDVSFIGVNHPEHGPGLDLWVGGGLSTNPMLAQRLGAWVPLDEVPDVWEAVVSLFRDYGYRRLRAKARIKFLVKDWGVQKFREVLENEYLTRPLIDGPAPDGLPGEPLAPLLESRADAPRDRGNSGISCSLRGGGVQSFALAAAAPSEVGRLTSLSRVAGATERWRNLYSATSAAAIHRLTPATKAMRKAGKVFGLDGAIGAEGGLISMASGAEIGSRRTVSRAARAFS